MRSNNLANFPEKIKQALIRARGDREEASKILGCNKRTLYRVLKDYPELKSIGYWRGPAKKKIKLRVANHISYRDVLALDKEIRRLELDGHNCFDKEATLASLRSRSRLFMWILSGKKGPMPSDFANTIRDRGIPRER